MSSLRGRHSAAPLFMAGIYHGIRSIIYQSLSQRIHSFMERYF